LDLDPAKLRLESWDEEAVRKLFTSLEFRSLHERLREVKFHAPANAPALQMTSIADFTSETEFDAGQAVALAWNKNWLALSDKGETARVLRSDEAMERLRSCLEDPRRQKIAHDAKILCRFALAAGIDIEGLYCDTKIGAYLLDPGAASGYTLGDTAQRYLGVSIHADQPGQSASAEEQGSLVFTTDEKTSVCREAVAVRALAPILEERLRAQGIWELATALEFPLVQVLARMEHTGILIDRDYLEKLNAEFGSKMTLLENTIQELAGEEFNVNSNLQLQRILFEKLALPKTRKIKTGYSTDAAELEKLAGTHQIIASLLEYREVAKLKNGFTEMLLALIDAQSGRIHTTYEQCTAATGRLSSSAPNLQNIPIRGDLGRQIRRAFIAPEGHVLLSADYSQIELRILAHLSEDETFCEAFGQGHDFHATIAAKIHGVDRSAVSSAMRNQVKQFSYGIAYGMSTYGVSQRLGVEMDEAANFVEAYYAQFPKVKEFLTSQVDKAKIDGFTTTMFGRRRYLPELQSANFRLRALGERMALNAPIQGSAADILKRAMINVDQALRKNPLGKMLLTVHDELVFEVPRESLSEARALIEGEMIRAANLRCGLAVEIHSGTNWADAHA
ncbi:MAG TPA: DNA polymerase, partial [Candidatus Binatia bacterium]